MMADVSSAHHGAGAPIGAAVRRFKVEMFEGKGIKAPLSRLDHPSTLTGVSKFCDRGWLVTAGLRSRWFTTGSRS